MPRKPAHELTGTKMASYIGMTNVELRAIKNTLLRGMNDASMEPRDWMHLFGQLLTVIEEAQEHNQRALDLVKEHGVIGPFYDPARELRLLAERAEELQRQMEGGE